MATDQDTDNPEGRKINRFLIAKFIKGGSFGRIYLGKDTKTGEEVAIKMEKVEISRPQLPFEFSFYRKLKAEGQQHKGIPKIHFFGRIGNWHALVMDLLGPSLEDVHSLEAFKQQFSTKTTLLLAIQLIHIFEYFHGKTLIFRDVKPENFLFGRPNTDKYSTLHIIDLGLSKEYIDETGAHIGFRSDKGMTGTIRYVSINSHKGYEISRRDDMEAVGYMIVYFIKGELPWMGLNAKDTKTKYSLIGRVKEKTKPDQLCSDIPKEFAQYIKDVRELSFDEEPKYKDYIKLFNKAMDRNHWKDDGIYDFDRNHKPIKK